MFLLRTKVTHLFFKLKCTSTVYLKEQGRIQDFPQRGIQAPQNLPPPVLLIGWCRGGRFSDNLNFIQDWEFLGGFDNKKSLYKKFQPLTLVSQTANGKNQSVHIEKEKLWIKI